MEDATESHCDTCAQGAFQLNLVTCVIHGPARPLPAAWQSWWPVPLQQSPPPRLQSRRSCRRPRLSPQPYPGPTQTWIVTAESSALRQPSPIPLIKNWLALSALEEAPRRSGTTAFFPPAEALRRNSPTR